MEKNKDTDVNNLKEYGNAFQSKCIAALVSDKSFLEQIVDILSPDHFETDAHKWVIKMIVDYFLEYKDLPTKEVFYKQVRGISTKQEVLKEAVKIEVLNAYSHINDADNQYIKDQFLEFCKLMKLKTAIWNSVEHLKSGNHEAIQQEINNAMKAGAERNLGHEYLSDIDTRMSQMCRDTVKTNWPLIDAMMDGGLGKGELGFIVAPAGSGKSWLLVGIGAEAIKQGVNVLHVTLELNENYVGLRYDAYLTGLAFQDVRNNIDQVKKKIEEHKLNGGGELFVKYFPLKTVSPQSIKLHIERLELLHGLKIGALVVDYADILRPFLAEKNSNSYSEAGGVYEELRQVAGELQIPVWSASQSNRGAHEEDVIQAHNVADSYRKIMTGDFIFSLSRKTEDKIANTGRIHIIKNRFGPDGDTYPLEFNTSNGYSRIYDKDSDEGRAIFAKTKDQEQTIKDILKNKWNEHKGNGGGGANQN
jgi:replicative DNA helicase